MIKEERSVVICSDIHLMDDQDEKHHILILLINSLDSSEVECFVLNGDIFDFCFGGHRYFREKFHLLGEALSALAERGIRVVFVQGNHEFDIPSLGWKGVEYVTDFVVTHQTASGHVILLTHGDRLMAPWHYHLYARFVRSWLFSFVASFLPGKPLDDLALWLSALSRSKVRTLNHQGLFDRALLVAEAFQADSVVIGHFHDPYMHKEKIYGLMSWDKPNILVFKQGQYRRVWLAER